MGRRSPRPKKRSGMSEVRTSFATTLYRRNKMQSMLMDLGVSQSEFLDACVDALVSGKVTGSKLGIRISVKV